MKKAFSAIWLFIMLACLSSALAAPDYIALKRTIGMNKDEVRAKFGAPDKATDPLVDPNSQGTWRYRNVIHPESGKRVSCALYFYPGGVAKVVCN